MDFTRGWLLGIVKSNPTLFNKSLITIKKNQNKIFCTNLEKKKYRHKRLCNLFAIIT